MTRSRSAVAVVLGLAAWASAAGGPVADFRLRDQAGKSHRLYANSDARAVVVIAQGNGCPILEKSLPAIEALRARFAPRKVVFWLINAFPQDDSRRVAREAAQFSIRAPVLMDREQAVSRALGLTRTAEAAVIDTADWTVRYRGAIDDRFDYAGEKPRPTKTYLSDALEAVLEGRPVPVAETQVKGCLLTYRGRGAGAPSP